MKKRENYLLFVPSLLTDRSQKITYTAGEKHWQYEGMQTNEAVTKYLSDYLHEQGTKLTKIILLCSKEVLNNKLEIAGQRTTLEYYQEAIWDYLEKYRDDYKDPQQLFQTIPLMSENGQTAEEIVAPIKQVLEIAEHTSADADKHLYVDFTGGLRNSALTLVFACRILQSMGVGVDKILYSNINSKSVEECTKTYEYFEQFEYLVKKQYAPDNFDRYDESIKKLPQNERNALNAVVSQLKGIQEKTDLNQLNKVADSSIETIARFNQVKADIEKGPVSESAKTMLNRLEEDIRESVQVIADQSKYPELPIIEEALRKGQYDKALNLYREKIISILYKGQIIKVGSRFLKNRANSKEKELNEYSITQEIIGVYCYYEHPDASRTYPHKTFMDAVLYALNQLNRTPDLPPKTVISKSMGDSFYDITWYLENNRIPSKSFLHNDFSRNICNTQILPHIKADYGIIDINDFVDKYNKLDRIYMCYGFPFAATYDKWFLNGYDQAYRDILEDGINCLQDFYDQKYNAAVQRMLQCFPEEHFTYKTLIAALLDSRYSRMLHILFPFRLNKRSVQSTSLKNEQWDDFIYSFVKSFCLIKNVRNKKIHKSDLESADMQRAIDEIKESLALIKKYIR